MLAAGRARGAGGAGREAAWNHGEFAVAYPSLRPHLCLGGVYVRLLLEGLDQARRPNSSRNMILVSWAVSTSEPSSMQGAAVACLHACYYCQFD